GIMPLALGTGPRSDERRAIAVVVIGGQTLSLLLTLIVTPVAYSLLDDIGTTEGWRSIASRLHALTHFRRKRLHEADAERRGTNEIDGSEAEIKDAAQEDDENEGGGG